MSIILESKYNDNIFLPDKSLYYHITLDSNVDSIMKDGLVPSTPDEDHKNGVYLTSNPYEVLQHGFISGNRKKYLDHSVLFSINKDKLKDYLMTKGRMVQPDNQYNFPLDYKRLKSTRKEFIVHSVIPKELVHYEGKLLINMNDEEGFIRGRNGTNKRIKDYLKSINDPSYTKYNKQYKMTIYLIK